MAQGVERTELRGGDGFGAYRGVRSFLLVAMVVALLTAIPFALQSSSASQALSVATVAAAIGAAALAGGGLIGFIFGIPRSLQDARPVAPRPDGDAAAGNAGNTATAAVGAEPAILYAGNTSLEQISDWLTKILVGVGLTQLANLPSGLEALAGFLAPGLGDLPGAGVYSIALVMVSVLIGFFLSYLWTRLTLPSLFVEADIQARVRQAAREGEQRGEQQGEQRALQVASSAIGQAGTTIQRADKSSTALWVNDDPDSKTIEEESIRKLLDVSFETVTSTEEALTKLREGADRFAFVISDIQRGRDDRAGYDLINRMRADGITTPIIFYTRYTDPSHDPELRKLGAVGATNSPSKLVELVAGVLKREVPG